LSELLVLMGFWK